MMRCTYPYRQSRRYSYSQAFEVNWGGKSSAAPLRLSIPNPQHVGILKRAIDSAFLFDNTPKAYDKILTGAVAVVKAPNDSRLGFVPFATRSLSLCLLLAAEYVFSSIPNAYNVVSPSSLHTETLNAVWPKVIKHLELHPTSSTQCRRSDAPFGQPSSSSPEFSKENL